MDFYLFFLSLKVLIFLIFIIPGIVFLIKGRLKLGVQRNIFYISTFSLIFLPLLSLFIDTSGTGYKSMEQVTIWGLYVFIFLPPIIFAITQDLLGIKDV